jgi:hypothetical protein
MAKKIKPSEVVRWIQAEAIDSCLAFKSDASTNEQRIAPKHVAAQPVDIALEGRPAPLRSPVTVRYDNELLEKVRTYLAQHKKQTRRRIYLQDACEDGLRLWAKARGIK